MQTSTSSPRVTITTPGPNGTTQTIIGPATAELLARRAEIIARIEQTSALRTSLLARIEAGAPSADVSRMKSQLKSLTSEANQLRIELAATDRAIANSSNVAVTQAPIRPFPAKLVTSLATIGGFFAVLLPISIAMATRIWRRPASSTNQLTPQVEERLNRLENGIEAIAIEMERVSEGQRYVTKLLSSDKIADKLPR